MEVAGDELCSLSPCDNVDEIGLLLFTLSLEAAIDRNGESGDCDAGSGGTQFGSAVSLPIIIATLSIFVSSLSDNE